MTGPHDASPSNDTVTVKDQNGKNHYSFHTSKRLGCTTLIRVGCATSGGRKFSCSGKLIPAAKKEHFLCTEGGSLRVLHTKPHPHIVRLVSCLDPTTEGGPSFLVVPKFGENLHSIVRRRKGLAEAVTKKIFFQITSAVAHCHRYNIVSRDIKLGKIFFSNAQRSDVVFADLDGSQVLLPESPLLHDQRGSPAYVSPEVLSCKPYNGFKADMWALGVVLYVLLTGCYPFQDSRPAKLFNKIQQGWRGVTFPETVSRPARRIICRLLCCQPDLRPTAKDLLEDPWVASGAANGRACACAHTVSQGPLTGAQASAPTAMGYSVSEDDQTVPEVEEDLEAKRFQVASSALLLKRMSTTGSKTIPKLPLLILNKSASGSLSLSAGATPSPSPTSPMSGAPLLQMWPRLGTMVKQPSATEEPSSAKRLRQTDEPCEKASTAKLYDWSSPAVDMAPIPS